MRLVSTSEGWLGAVLIAAFVIDGDLTVLSEGPPCGTEVVTVGAAKLFATELGVGK